MGSVLRNKNKDLDTWLRKTGIGLRSVLNAWARRMTGMSFVQLVESNPRLAATIAYQVLGDDIGGLLANIILEHYSSEGVEKTGEEHSEEQSKESLGGGINGQGSAFSFSFSFL